MEAKRISNLDELKLPGVYDIPLTMNGPAFQVVQNLRLAGHAVTHDETRGPGYTATQQIRVFHYKTCKVCQGYHT